MSSSSQHQVRYDGKDEEGEVSLDSLCSSEEFLPYLFQLMQEYDWEEIRKSLHSSDGFRLCQESDVSNLSCLALALARNAPIDIIKIMIETDPSLPRKCDEYGATALHVAVLNGASFESIDYLLKSNPSLAREVDFDDRSALHHAVEYTCGEYTKTKVLRSVDVIRRLCNIAPEMIHIQDSVGSTPIDLVQLIKIRLDTNSDEYRMMDLLYQSLKIISVKVYKAQKELWEGDEGALRERLSRMQTNDQPALNISESEHTSVSNTPPITSSPYPEILYSTNTSSQMLNVSVFNDIQFTVHEETGQNMDTEVDSSISSGVDNLLM